MCEICDRILAANPGPETHTPRALRGTNGETKGPFFFVGTVKTDFLSLLLEPIAGRSLSRLSMKFTSLEDALEMPGMPGVECKLIRHDPSDGSTFAMYDWVMDYEAQTAYWRRAAVSTAHKKDRPAH